MKRCCCICRATDRRLYLPDADLRLYCPRCLPMGDRVLERAQVLLLRSQEIRENCQQIRLAGEERRREHKT